MQKLIAGLIVATMILAPFALAQQDFSAQLQTIASQYNSNLDKVPSVLKAVAGSEKMNLHITYPDGKETVMGIETKDGKIVNTSDKLFTNPTINIYTKSETVDKIVNSKDPFAEAGKVFSKNEITYSGVGFWAKLKIWIVRFLLSIMGFIIFPAN